MKNKNKIRNTIKNTALIILGGILFGTFAVYAETLLSSNQVIYDNSNSGAYSDTVQGALDDLYTRTQFYKNFRIIDSKLEVGDEVAIGSEHFYVVSSDPNGKTILLAKYNLYIGNICQTSASTSCTEISSTEEGYGLQNEKARGYVSEQERIGTVYFSDTTYWYDDTNAKLKPEYGASYNESKIYDENSNLKKFVDAYMEKLKKLGAPSEITGRILTYQEVQDLGCKGNIGEVACSDSYDWVYSTSYWLGTARSSNTIYRLDSDGKFQNSINSYILGSGLRPVVEVNTSDIIRKK